MGARMGRAGARLRPVPAATGTVPAHGDGLVEAPARVDVRTKNLLTRIQSGEVAVIDHLDLDRLAAEGLVQVRPAAVLNAARSISPSTRRRGGSTRSCPACASKVLLKGTASLID